MTELSLPANNLKDCKKAQYQIAEMIKENYLNFVKSIKENNISAFNESIEWGIDWAGDDIWSILGQKFSLDTANAQFLELLTQFKPPYESLKNVEAYSISRNTHDKWQAVIEDSLKRTFNTNIFNGELLLWMTKNRPQIVNDIYIIHSMKKFLKENISEEKFNTYHDFYIENYPTLVKNLFLSAKGNNLKFLLDSPIYNEIKTKLFEKENLSQKLMTNAVMFLKLEDIKFLEKNGIEFHLSKQALSEIFSKKIDQWNEDQLDFIQKRINDIRIHSDVILKTSLKTNQKDYIPFIVEQYFYQDQLDCLNELWKDREQNNALILAKEHFQNVTLYQHLEEVTEKKYKLTIKRKV